MACVGREEDGGFRAEGSITIRALMRTRGPILFGRDGGECRRQPSATSGQIEGDASPLSLWVTEIKVSSAAAAAASFLPSFLLANAKICSPLES